jgi:hypothetical protein
MILFVVDEQFADELCRFRWQNEGHGYLLRAVEKDGKRTGVLLHREVWRLAHGTVPKELNHKNGLKWDCRLENLEPATRRLNNLDRRYRKRALPLGVYQRGKKFLARLGFERLGLFATAEEASASYETAKKAAIQHERNKL